MTLPRSRKLAKLTLAAVAALTALVAIELVCRWTRTQPRSLELVADGLRERDPLLGYRAQANARVHAVKRFEGELVFEVDYSIDEHGRRVSPLAPDAAPTKFALFFGDSFTFGHGLADDETLAVQLARHAPEYRPYNYGLPGWGPQQTLALLETRDLHAEIGERSGIAIYTFIDAHVRRAIGSMHNVRWQSRFAPCYELRDDATLERTGNFMSARPWTTRVYSLLASSAAIERLEIDLPRLTERHFELVAALLNASAAHARKQLGCERFIVILFPGSSLGARVAAHLDPRLVECWNYGDETDSPLNQRIARDGHPTARACEALGERIARELAAR